MKSSSKRPRFPGLRLSGTDRHTLAAQTRDGRAMSARTWKRIRILELLHKQWTLGDVEIDRLPAVVRRKLPRYPLPVLRLARLGVDRSAQGQGLGLQLLRFVLRLTLRMADDCGCLGVIVDAKPDAVVFYAKYGFLTVEAVEGASDARPAPTPMFLSIHAIQDAIGGRR